MNHAYCLLNLQELFQNVISLRATSRQICLENSFRYRYGFDIKSFRDGMVRYIYVKLFFVYK